MSKHPTDSVELQRLTDTFDKNMSVPDPSITDIGDMAPMYNTVEVAQTAAQDFKDRQTQIQEDYTHPGPLDPFNQYDVVTDKQRENTSPGYLHQNNILYADQFAAQEMRHATLTRSDQHKYSGPTSEETVNVSREVCGCSNFCLWFMVVLVISFVALLAIGAMVMVVLVIVQVIPVCNCAASPEEVQTLRDTVESLTAAQQSISSNVLNLTQQLNSLDVVPAIESAIGERITEDGTILGVNFSAVLMDFEPFSDCINATERFCDVLGINLCETPDLALIPPPTSDTVEYTYLRDARCTRSPLSTDGNILVTSLVIDRTNNLIYCLCYRRDRGVSTAILRCDLETTRCRPSRNIPVNIVTTSSATPSRN